MGIELDGTGRRGRLACSSGRSGRARRFSTDGRTRLRTVGHRGVCLVACAALAACSETSARTAELIVVDERDCPSCERFDGEIAATWGASAQGRELPIRRVGLHERWPDDLSRVERPAEAPTFILVEHGGELGRLVGYPGSESFRVLVDQLLEVRENRIGAANRPTSPSRRAGLH